MVRPHEKDAYHRFIKGYCLRDSPFRPKVPLTNSETIEIYWKTLCLEYLNVNQDAIKRYLRGRSDTKSSYRNVYLTTYWWYVIKHKRKLIDGFKCTNKDCDGTCTTLEVHHKNIPNTNEGDYTHKGEEIKYMDCLETLCSTCHAKKHDIEDKPKKKRRRTYKRNGEVILTRTEDRILLSPVVTANEFNERIESKFSIDVTPKEYVVTVTSLRTDELRRAIVAELDILLDILD